MLIILYTEYYLSVDGDKRYCDFHQYRISFFVRFRPKHGSNVREIDFNKIILFIKLIRFYL